MTPDTAQAARYRHRAIEVRLAADMTRDRASKQILFGVADDWDRMAKTMDAIAQTETTIARLNLGGGR